MTERLFLRLDEDASHGPESGAPAGTLSARAVCRELREHVSHMLVYREAIAPGREVVERVVPDAAVRLVFSLDGAPRAGASALAIGASIAPALVRLSGHQHGVSVTLQAGAASALLGAPAGELAEQVVDLDALWRGDGARLLERMAGAADDRARMALLEATLLERARRARQAVSRQALAAVRCIANSGGQLEVAEVAARVELGERRLQQLFHAHVGASPRAFRRVARLRACLRLLRQRPVPCWARVALDAGYYDQAHLANDFRALCGLSPSAFLERAISGSSKTAG